MSSLELNKSNQSVRILFSCTGVGIFNRGIETFFREAFDGLKTAPGLEAQLIKGAGHPQPDEAVVWNLPRTGRVAPWLGHLAQRNGYVVEQWSSFLPIAQKIRQYRPQIIFYSDSNLGFLLYWFRAKIGVPYRLLFSNGGPCSPPFSRTDFVHQVAPTYYDAALEAGESPQKHFLVPYGIGIPNSATLTCQEDVIVLRRQLQLPIDRPIIISVGALDPSSHKRMDYVIREVAQLPEPRPYLLLLGQITPTSKTLLNQAELALESNNYTARCVAYEEVNTYYQAADIFVLASLQEGFGRVFLEALLQGLPCIVHDHPVMRYVLDEHGVYGNFSQPGHMASIISRQLRHPRNAKDSYARRLYVQQKFSWEALAPKYLKMFEACASAL